MSARVLKHIVGSIERQFIKYRLDNENITTSEVLDFYSRFEKVIFINKNGMNLSNSEIELLKDARISFTERERIF